MSDTRELMKLGWKQGVTIALGGLSVFIPFHLLQGVHQDAVWPTLTIHQEAETGCEYLKYGNAMGIRYDANHQPVCRRTS